MTKKINTKNSSKINSKKITTENEMMRFIKMIIIVTLVFLAFYVLTIFINKDETKEENKDNNKTPVSIQYDQILIGNIFNQNSKQYYVLIEDSEDAQVQVYEAYLSVYKTKQDAKRVYIAKMNNMFNSKYVADKSNISNDITEFKISSTTLLEISDGKIVNSYETKEKILEILKNISQKEETKE